MFWIHLDLTHKYSSSRTAKLCIHQNQVVSWDNSADRGNLISKGLSPKQGKEILRFKPLYINNHRAVIYPQCCKYTYDSYMFFLEKYHNTQSFSSSVPKMLMTLRWKQRFLSTSSAFKMYPDPSFSVSHSLSLTLCLLLFVSLSLSLFLSTPGTLRLL